jgi:16S rRNA (cytosine967-C5)-methyltransferase
VVAVERDSGRMGRLRENMVRLKLAPELVNADVLKWRPGRLFDAVLLDAPCTATGTIRRHPDLPYLKQSKDIAKLAGQQKPLLEAAAKLLKPGGRLVFATCSLQAEEGEAHLANLPEGLRIDPIRAEEVPEIGATPAGRAAHPARPVVRTGAGWTGSSWRASARCDAGRPGEGIPRSPIFFLRV